MFAVTKVRSGILWKQVELIAIDQMVGTDPLIRSGRHWGFGIFECPYRFPKGTKLTLRFASWRRGLHVGDQVDLERVLRHPTIQRSLMEAARSGTFELGVTPGSPTNVPSD